MLISILYRQLLIKLSAIQINKNNLPIDEVWAVDAGKRSKFFNLSVKTVSFSSTFVPKSSP